MFQFSVLFFAVSIAVFPVICALLFVIAGTPFNSEHEDSQSRIVGGSCDTVITLYPYQVSLQYLGSHVCGGSIISSNYVLTAASCVVYSTSGYSIRAGTSTVGSGGNVYSVASIIRHSSYSSTTFDYNVALIRISGSFPNTINIKPVALQEQNDSIPSGTSAVITGWGAHEGKGAVSSILRRSTIFTKSVHGDVANLNSVVLCQGDSGGPVVAIMQIGVLSYNAGVYTKVLSVRSWIRNNSGV